MNTCMCDPDSFLRKERETLEWLKTKPWVINSSDPLYHAIEQSLLRMKNTFGMRVFLSWQVAHKSLKDSGLQLCVGGNVEIEDSKFSQVSYSLCVSRNMQNEKRRYVLRKYHFDYANPSSHRRQPHPIFHLQYSGTLPQELRQKLDDTHQNPEFDEPRVFYTPVSLALVLHMAFREFPKETTERLRKDSGWRRLLIRDQQELLSPFYQACINTISSKKIIMDEAYGA